MNGDIVAQRYARALFELGKEQGMPTLELYGETLTSLDSMVNASPDLSRLFRAPVITVAEKRNVLQVLLKKMKAGETVSNFCFLLADKERLPLLSNIVAYFCRLLDEAKGIIRGKLLTAVKLDKERQAGILASLEQQTRKQLALRFEVDPAILGGVVLQVGDTVLDASLRAQLNILRDIIKRGE